MRCSREQRQPTIRASRSDHALACHLSNRAVFRRIDRLGNPFPTSGSISSIQPLHRDVPSSNPYQQTADADRAMNCKTPGRFRLHVRGWTSRSSSPAESMIGNIEIVCLIERLHRQYTLLGSSTALLSVELVMRAIKTYHKVGAFYIASRRGFRYVITYRGSPALASIPTRYRSFAYSAFAAIRMGMSGSASFQRVRKS